MSSNKFLNGSDGVVSLSDLQDGSLSLYVNRLKTQGIVEAADYESKTTFSYNDEIQKIDNLEASTEDNTNITGNLHVGGEITVPKITDISGLSRIDLDDTDINILSQNLTFNGSNITTSADLQTLNTKTFYIDPLLSIGNTKFNSTVSSDGFILNNGPTPAGLLKSDGSITYDSEYIIVNTPPFNNIQSIIESKGDVYYDTTSTSIYGFQPPFRDEPAERVYPFTNFTNFNVATEAEFISAIGNEIPPLTTLQITITTDITFTSTKTITDSIKITSDTGTRTITYSTATNIIFIESVIVLVLIMQLYRV